MRRLRLPRAPAAAVVLLSLGAGAGAEEPPPPVPVPLSVRIISPRGGQTSERVVPIRALVQGFAGDRATLVLNAVPMSVAVRDGVIEVPQVLSPGLNAVRVLVEDGAVVAEDAVSVFARVPSKDLRVTLTWDRPSTDVDLWVTGPDGEKILYSNRQGKAGGTLDTDVTTGYGPETYTHARLLPGAYRIQAHYYGGALPCRVEVTTVRFEGAPDEERRTFRAVLLKPGDVAEVGEVLSK